MLLYLIPLLCIFMHIFTMEPNLENRFQKEVTQAIERSNTLKEAQEWLESLKALKEYSRFFGNPVTQETIQALLSAKFGSISLSAQPSLLGVLPGELLLELGRYNLHTIMQNARSLDEAIAQLQQLTSNNTTAAMFNDIKAIKGIVESLFRKFSIGTWAKNVKAPWNSRSSIANRLSLFVPAAQQWLEEQKKKAPDETALINAAATGDVAKAQALLNKGTDPNTSYTDHRIEEPDGFLHYYSPLWAALKNSRVQVARLLLDHGANPHEIKWLSAGTTPLMYVALALIENGKQSDQELLKVLLEKGARPEDKNVMGYTIFEIIRDMTYVPGRAKGSRELVTKILRESQARKRR